MIAKKSRLSKLIILVPIIVFLIFAAIYVASLFYTMNKYDGEYTSRIWLWTEYFIGASALIVILKNYKNINLKYILIGLAFAIISGVSSFFRLDLITTLQDSIIVFIAFLAGCILSNKEGKVKSSFGQGNYKKALKSIGIGILLSVPFALINFLYFKQSTIFIDWQNPFTSALLALEPGISEEIVYRFFIMNLFIQILKDKLSNKTVIFISMFLAVVPHSLIHFPELWIINRPQAFFLLVSTSLLFGLPMACIQYKRDLETAQSFHWFIDFIRFLGGF